MIYMTAIVVLVILIITIAMRWYPRHSKKIQLPDNYKELLDKHVPFYRHLDASSQERFTEKIKGFLSYVHIEGVGTSVDDLDKLLVASSAIIPIFGFPEWKYYNLNDVLLYPDTFNNDEFLEQGSTKNTLGMVGNGAMQRMMILSKKSLHAGFEREAGNENTGIHEFVHLLDKEDGDVDGMPEALLSKTYLIPWLELINKNTAAILEGNSDIKPYGATNKAEFFAVVSEYFFTNPVLFKKNHAALYEILSKIFQQKPS